ncbi:4-hydroxyphenylacetate decarboxylase activating enzyme [Clostridium saccharobutylicum]|uniref:AmmeMemoRadiSam system radical SAM enzyme n=1 Tax=Clostridium saccharobutylicum TaxID=169679 RepID=UPI000983E090|nr:AmmeMemoRadiSam system radical SAM enzyme [Clostridium saccharobutylicum]AQS10989.1 4-hydroxyphenylacetate decarboxylase activating enzyme [Clostridium saccharobutylicum]MBC2436291.1 AmmeMemoRadiSam system radical SAM enzyme [Clostridium saccharobutylicum]NSB88238.1 pyruvate formate lyase activating enzyme [Clostridium saccharobutylicum]NYC31983.1 pyruvate formate lyase activating enzyme [Clostridium saccharobutylicum]OOM18052.1 4-hydroxyphenylacetate decarboxylase activating enzyme [Clostr
MDAKVLFYEKFKDNIKCRVCPHNCMLSEGKFGICSVRTLKSDIPIAINYGEIASCGVDPIEKKPLYHFKPSKNILSVGTFGCNMTCTFCQNHEISQNRPQTQYISTNKLINIINEVENNAGIAFTYNEPFMWYEYIYDVAKSIKEVNPNTSVVIVTNGYINEEPLMKLLPYVDAMNIDLKGYTNKYYNKICGAKLDPVLETIRRCNDHCHVEITTLLVRDENDSIEEASEIAKFIASVNENIPLHLSRYFPRYKMNNAATKVECIIEAQREAKKYLKYVYVGNVDGIDNNTYCPKCNELLIRRNGYNTEVMIEDNRCRKCGEEINIII